MPFVSVVRAQYDYAPQSAEELEIKDGDLLFVLEKSIDDDWWRCKKKAASEDDEEPEGLVPNNYVDEVLPTHQAKALYDYTKQTDEELSFKEDASLDVYDESDPDWTLVGSNGEYGFAPAIYIEKIEAASANGAPPANRVLAAPPMPTRPPVVDQGPIPGEADYPSSNSRNGPSPGLSGNAPAAQLAGIIAQRTGTAQMSTATDRTLASPPLPQRPQYTPEESEEEEAPSLPQRPPSLPPTTSPTPPNVTSALPLSPEPPRSLTHTPERRIVATRQVEDSNGESLRSPGGFHLYNVHEMIQHMGKNKKMPTTLGINIGKGIIMISPEKSRDGPSHEWTADKLTHYSIEGKHVFVELVRPSKSVDFHAGAKDTAQEIVSALGELAGAVRQEGLREVIAASAGTGSSGKKLGKMIYEFMAQGDDEVTVALGDEVIILDDIKSDEWWMVRRLKTGEEGVVPSSYVETTGVMANASESISGLDAARGTVEQNRIEEERLTKEAARQSQKRSDSEVVPPERHSSLAGDTRRTSMRGADKRASNDQQSRGKPNQARVRTWTDRSGTFKVEAEFIGLREGKIHLHKLNGVKIAVPVTKMAVEDLEYVERATGASLDDDKPLSDIKRRNTQKGKATDGQASRTTAGASITNKEEDQWFDFFLQCGVNPQICQRYAQAFARDQMSPDNLPEVNEQVLRTLGLKEGDILRVMKHLDGKYDRKRGLSPMSQDNGMPNTSEGGLFSGPGGALRNNTRKGRPAPAVQTNDVIDENAFRQRGEKAAVREPGTAVNGTTTIPSPGTGGKAGFDDDAWDVKPTREKTPVGESSIATPSAASVKSPAPNVRKSVNDDLASLSISAPVLQPSPAVATSPIVPIPSQPPSSQEMRPAQPPVADQAIFDKIAALAPAARQNQMQNLGPPAGFSSQGPGAQSQSLQPQHTIVPRQRPAPPPMQQTNGTQLTMPPPPRASSAPGFPPPQSTFGQSPLQPQLTGYQPQQHFQPLQPQQTDARGFGQGYPQMNPVQAMQQNFPALQPQPTGFQPQSQFGQQQSQQYSSGGINYQGQLLNGQQPGSPFADPSRPMFQAVPSGLSNSFTAQPTGFQPSFNLTQATGAAAFGAQPTQAPPQLPLQQTGGVFGPSQPINVHAPPMPLVPQKTGPPPPVRFGVQPGVKALAPQPTGRANLAKATPQNPFGF